MSKSYTATELEDLVDTLKDDMGDKYDEFRQNAISALACLASKMRVDSVQRDSVREYEHYKP